MRRISIILVLLSFVLLNLPSLLYGQGQKTVGSSVQVPVPRLISPTSEVVDIKDKKGILFKWSSQQIPSGGRRNFRFQLYEGYEMYEKNLIFKKEFDPFTYEIFIEKDKFKDDTAYTWSVRQRGYFSNWSKRGFHTFKVTK